MWFKARQQRSQLSVEVSLISHPMVGCCQRSQQSNCGAFVIALGTSRGASLARCSES